MTASEKIAAKCKEKGISVHKLEQSCGFANGYIRQLKGDLPYDRLHKVMAMYGWRAKDLISDDTIKSMDLLDDMPMSIAHDLRHLKAEIDDEPEVINKEQLAFVFGPGVDEEELKKEEKLPSFDGNAFFKDLEKIEVVQADGSVKPYYVPRLRNSVAGESMKKAMEEANKIQGIVMKNQKKPESSMEIKLLELFRSLPNQAKAKFLKTAESMADFYSN